MITTQKKIISTLTMLSLLSLCVTAQTTIFNTPSTDVVQKGGSFVEGGFITHANTYENGGFQTYGIRGIYGLTRNFEIGTNLFVTKTGSGKPTEIQPNFKWKAFASEKHGVAISTGALISVPLNSAAGNRSIGMFYANSSKKFDSLKGLRLTSGFYGVVGANESFGSRYGATVAVEKPIFKRVSAVADWYTGKNRFGYSGAGLSIAVNSRDTLFMGYSFGNSGRANNSFAISYGRSF